MNGSVQCALACALAAFGPVAGAQDGTGFVLHNTTNLVLVDTTVVDANGAPVKDLSKSDFKVFDNGREASLVSFEGAETSARPLALWLVVQCKMGGWEAQGSGLFAGQISRLVPAIAHLRKQDLVGVAHWCDNGDAAVDLPPTAEYSRPTATMERVLAAAPDQGHHGRPGELALQKMLEKIVEATRPLTPEHLPAIIFLYGDYSSMPKVELNHFVGELLSTSVVAYGIRDTRSPVYRWPGLGGEQGAVSHFIASQTGGQYLSATPESYQSVLARIIDDLQFRYELGFRPVALDGKRHKLEVKLAGDAGRRKDVRLHSRAAYIAAEGGLK